MPRVYKTRADFLAAEPDRRLEAMVRTLRAGPTLDDRMFARGIRYQELPQLEMSVTEFRAQFEFNERERVLLAIEAWGSKIMGGFFPGGQALTKLIAELRDGPERNEGDAT